MAKYVSLDTEFMKSMDYQVCVIIPHQGQETETIITHHSTERRYISVFPVQLLRKCQSNRLGFALILTQNSDTQHIISYKTR